MSKIRLDILLVEKGLVESRAKAQALIMAGLVYSGEKKLDKAGMPLPQDAPLELRGQDHPWVSRGGVKLAHGLAHFDFKVEGRTALDIGASTGGFTDVLLSNGAAKVYAVDVGFGQLAWKLRHDPRVVVVERTNARYLTPEIIPEPIDILVCDASFIGLRTLLPAGLGLVKPGGMLLVLIKPQFEAGPENLRKGVVKDPSVHQAVCAMIKDWLESLKEWQVLGITESPIAGPEGNLEFLLGAKKIL